MVAAGLPTYPVPFIGRDDELALITAQLNEPMCHLLTLVGTGGIGKTRLSIEAARLQENCYSDGVFFVPLQPLNRSEFIVPAIAQALNLQFFPGTDTTEQLLTFLKAKELLLLLDNFEHLLDGADIVSKILMAAVHVKVLTTSRERLNVREEWVLEVDGLSFPQAAPDIPLEEYSAFQLFMANARRVRIGFSLDDQQRRAVIRICQLVGGMPLGIELASAWVRTLTCEDIAVELERSLDILATSTRNIPERHRDIRAVLEYSWSLLTTAERAVYAQLSVFRGGFRKEAAQLVAGTSLATLSTLVDKSLLRLKLDGRYELHELLRQFCEEKLRDDPNAEIRTRNRHSAYYADFMRQRENDLKGHRQREALDEITADFDNVRAAWAWISTQKDYIRVNLMAESLCLFCDMRNRVQEGLELFGRTREQFATHNDQNAERTWGRVSARWLEMARLQLRVNDSYEQFRDSAYQTLAIARKYEDQSEAAFSLWLLGVIAFFALDFPSVVAPFEESLALYTALGDDFHAAKVADYLAENRQSPRDFDQFLQLTQHSIELYRKIDDRYGLASALGNLTMAAVYSGNYRDAERYLRETDAIYHELNNEAKLARNHMLWAMIAFHNGDFDRARTLAQQSMDKSPEAMNSGRWKSMIILSFIASMQGDYSEAKHIVESIGAQDANQDAPKALAFATCGLGEDHAARQYVCSVCLDPGGYPGQQLFDWTRMLTIASILLAREGAEEEAVEALALALSHPISKRGWMDRWALLTETRAALQAELGDDVFEAAWKRGKARPLHEMIAWLVRRWQGEAETETTLNAAHTANNALPDPLSGRELEVLQLIAEGASNQHIAQQLVLSIGTVKKHINHIFGKLGVENRTQAVAQARNLDLL